MTRATFRWLFAAGALARVLALALPGTADVPDWKATSFVASTDLLHVYGTGGSPPDVRTLRWQRIAVTTEYPPISQVELALVGRVYRLIDPSFGDSRTLTVLIKVPGLMAEALFVWGLLTWGRRVMGDSPAQWAALAFWLNPAMWLGGSVLGYLDAQMAVPATLALIAASAARPDLAGVLAAVAVLTKPQAIFVLPIVAMVLLRRSNRWHFAPCLRAGAAGAVVLATPFVPFVAVGAGPSVVRAFQRLGEHDLVSGTATNIWWLVTWAAGSAARLHDIGVWHALSRPATMVRISTVMAAGWPNPRTMGTVVTAGALLWAVWRARRGLGRPAAAWLAAWCVLAYFMVSAQVHENHAYLALPLMAVAAADVPEWRPLYWLTSAAFFLNLYLFYGLGTSWPAAIDRRWTGIDASIVVAAVYIAIVAVMTLSAARATSGEPEVRQR